MSLCVRGSDFLVRGRLTSWPNLIQTFRNRFFWSWHSGGRHRVSSEFSENSPTHRGGLRYYDIVLIQLKATSFKGAMTNDTVLVNDLSITMRLVQSKFDVEPEAKSPNLVGRMRIAPTMRQVKKAIDARRPLFFIRPPFRRCRFC